jgi:hypothetical protein
MRKVLRECMCIPPDLKVLESQMSVYINKHE